VIDWLNVGSLKMTGFWTDLYGHNTWLHNGWPDNILRLHK